MIGVTSTGSQEMGVWNINCQCGGLHLHIRLTYVCRSEDVLDGLRDLGANAVTLDQADKVVALVELLENVRLNGTVCRCRRCRSE